MALCFIEAAHILKILASPRINRIVPIIPSKTAISSIAPLAAIKMGEQDHDGAEKPPHTTPPKRAKNDVISPSVII